MAMPAAPRCGLQGPVLKAQPSRSSGAVRTTHPVAPQDRDPPSVAAIATRRHETFWDRRPVSEGPPGPLTDALTKRRVTLCRDGLPARAVWLVMKRTLGEPPTSWYAISHAPLRTRVPPVVWCSGVRWAIAPCVEEATTELGMDHDAVRQSPGWHPHRLICRLAHGFLWHVTSRLGEKSAGLDPVPEADVSGRGLTVAPVYATGRARVGRLGATAQSQCLAVAQKTAGD